MRMYAVGWMGASDRPSAPTRAHSHKAQCIHTPTHPQAKAVSDAVKAKRAERLAAEAKAKEEEEKQGGGGEMS